MVVKDVATILAHRSRTGKRRVHFDRTCDTSLVRARDTGTSRAGSFLIADGHKAAEHADIGRPIGAEGHRRIVAVIEEPRAS
jgi:hypothetical protein